MDHVQAFIDLAVTPGGRPGDASPLAKPGYKGGRKLTDYERELAHALMRKGKTKREAIRMARGILNHAASAGRWGRGHVRNPAVRAGAIASRAQRASFAEAAEREGLVDLAAKWRHGWVPLNAEAVAELKRMGGEHIGGGHFLVPGKRAMTESHTTHTVHGPDGKKIGTVVTVHQHGGNLHLIGADQTKVNAQHFSSPKSAAKAVVKRHKRKLDTALAEAGRRDLDLAIVRQGQRYRHGWVPILDGPSSYPLRGRKEPIAAKTETPAELRRGIPTSKARSTAKPKPARRRKATPPTGNRKVRTARHQAKVDAAQREMARRIVASQGLGRGPVTRVRRGPGVPSAGTVKGNAFGGILRGHGLSSLSETDRGKLDLVLAEAGRRDIDLGVFNELLHPRGFHGRFIPKGGHYTKADKYRAGKDAEQFLGKHTRAGGMAKLARAEVARREADAASSGDVASKSAAEHARGVMAKARKAEPKITSDLKSVVGGVGGNLESLMATPEDKGDFRFKSHGSMTRKIRDKANTKYKHLPTAEGQARYASEIGDSLRYTAVFDNKTFVSDTRKMIAGFEAKGYKVESVENTFKRGQAYAGVNINLVSPDGHRWELQAHTPESIRAKHLIHDDYEIYRSGDVTEAEKTAAYNRMLAVNRNLIRPSNFEKLGVQKHNVGPDEVRRHSEALIGAHEQDLYRRGIYGRRKGRRKLRVT